MIFYKSLFAQHNTTRQFSRLATDTPACTLKYTSYIEIFQHLLHFSHAFQNKLLFHFIAYSIYVSFSRLLISHFS